MDKKERQYWFHILPIMSKKQVSKLRGILENEKKKLESINKDFSNKLKSNQDEKIARWESEAHKTKMEELAKKEKSEEKKEEEAEEKLLAALDNI